LVKASRPGGRDFSRLVLQSFSLGFQSAAATFLSQVDAAVLSTPLVVVPADELEEVLVQLDRGAGSKIEEDLQWMKSLENDLLVGVLENVL